MERTSRYVVAGLLAMRKLIILKRRFVLYVYMQAARPLAKRVVWAQNASFRSIADDHENNA